MTGFKKLFKVSITLVLLAIFIIPFQKHMVPNRFIDKLIASLVLSKIDEFNFSKFPEKIAKEKDIIIKIGQTIFNKIIPHKNFILIFIFYDNIIDLMFHLWYISRINKGLLKL